MAQSNISVDQDAFSCLLCRNLLLDPVTIPCGHSYCMGCIRSCWDRADPDRVHSCPSCSKSFAARPLLSSNIILAEMVQKIRTGKKRQATTDCQKRRASSCTHVPSRQDSPSEQKHRKTDFNRTQGDGACCPEHGKPLEVYCQTDGRSICLLCVIDAHKDHTTVSVVAERIEQQKQLGVKQRRSQEKVQERERALQELRLRVKSFKSSAQTAINDSEKVFTELIYSTEKWRTEVEDLIRAQEKTVVSHAEGLMERLEQEIAEQRRTDSDLKQLSFVEDHVDFLKRWASLCTHPELGDLSDITLDSQLPCDMLKSAVSDLKRQLKKVCEMQIPCISQTVNAVLQTPVLCVAEPSTREEFLQYACELTFNPDTAHKDLLLSPEYREVKRVQEIQPYPAHPERFSFRRQVLCREGLFGSRFYWEVELKGSKAEVAVTYQKIKRKGQSLASSFGGNDQSWSLDCNDGSYLFSHKNVSHQIPMPYFSQVGVYLDHRMGILSFYSISPAMTLLHRCQAKFTEPLYAGFWIGENVTVKLCHFS
ncbi:tripartite motif-containing protein 16-like protein [Scleropages formosus]|uniref:Tripartite motif-containing protein 16-like protein n=1 Tax=Scleropages formosus TaxID=113540 RepID=A0A8C9VAQ7_SCLFO|nr:tripartite motif-containing protein 16-like protein [Scleropages formosus]XP_018606382.2 tripartite motif-containing protein 16-like protein [Scleropages formosus]